MRPRRGVASKVQAESRRGASDAHGSSIEAKFSSLASRRGWEVHRSGWPDFFITDAGKAFFVEVKSSVDSLRPGQKRMFAALETAGITVMIWWEMTPNRLITWRKFRELKAKAYLSQRAARKARDRSRNPGMCGPREMKQLERSIRRMG